MKHKAKGESANSEKRATEMAKSSQGNRGGVRKKQHTAQEEKRGDRNRQAVITALQSSLGR